MSLHKNLFQKLHVIKVLDEGTDSHSFWVKGDTVWLEGLGAGPWAAHSSRVREQFASKQDLYHLS